ncbi:non-ribosomal peptide synthetase [Funiculus sociatus GB2-A5]|uniref:Non-ribosomal peptide synthetase n=1 Tax=Funiculus sociatus GB2-A5 TaxID=2933946 RepID=A0ABV0JJ87_9CYAN|nr:MULTISPECIES: non-ribosomal peptide synthetase [unclassified Trichocoleus]MBD1908662.1 amino acid adenylation domain-containing protein [Trichocoleus sp. FACHB-832]MBD2063284.1 amino acid adenylation domain-containing protein [Trichocoleus sp. FACHB-6]
MTSWRGVLLMTTNDRLERLKNLSPEKRALVLKALREQAVRTEESKVIPRRDRQQPAVLSFSQQRLWFLDQLEPGRFTYNIPAAVLLLGSLNIAALEQSFNEAIQRHEVLRTTFATHQGQPIQVIAPSLKLTLPVVDLRHLAKSERDAEIQKQAMLEAQQPFDLGCEPLLRGTLLHLDEAEYVLLFTMHHIVSDGWSIGVLIRELAALYEVYVDGQPSPLPELPIQYADFAVWQRQWLQGEVLKTQLSYWKQQLRGNLPALQLPTDRPRSPVSTFRGASQSFVLPASLSEALKALSQRENVTLFMTLLAAFKALLYRYTRQDDILVGTPIANRNRAEIEGLIGFFVNTLVMRTDISGTPSFRELLGRVREVALGAYAHQDLPFEHLVEELQPERDLSYHPLFQVAFVLQNAPKEVLKLPNLSLSFLAVESAIAKFDLTLTMSFAEEGLIGSLEYNTDLFDATTIKRMLGNFQTMLAGIVANPEARISELPLLTEAERQQRLTRNQTLLVPPSLCLHQLFEAQVERSPDAIAVVFEDEQLTYRELNQRANKIAHYLQSLGVGAETLVGICVERSLYTVVGLLGILKAGGAYVPLDPAYPSERLAFMLENSQVPVLLTQQSLVEALPTSKAKVVCLDTWGIAQESDANPVTQTTTDNLAYVIYTSGSTGQPKGVLIPHGNVVRLFDAVQSWYQFSDRDVWTLFHSYAFDFSVWELWGALLFGGRLVVVPYWVSRSPELFYDLLCKQQVTVLNQTPSAFRQLIRAEELANPTQALSLRLVIFGGEALNLQSLKPWFDRHGDQFPQLVNMYGITETTVHVTYRLLTAADLNLVSGSVIGCPIPDLQIYILDSHQQPVPIGVPGEMYVGGAGLARGYLNRTDLTSERFISNPFKIHNPQSERLYKTGDLARYLANGDIEYLGRIDDQVKIRGFRIELGEIEAVLTQHPAVCEGLVVTQGENSGEQRLVAYVVPYPEQAITISELRSFLNQLPNYMIPAAFVLLEAIPLTPNGKVDRRALPTPVATPERDVAFVAGRNFVEQVLTEIWAQVLGVQSVGIHDNFFNLGGDSIRSIQVRTQAQKHGIDFSIEQLFRYQTIGELAQHANRTESSLPISETEPFSLISSADRLSLPENVEDAYPLAMLQMGMLFHSAYSQDSTLFHDIFSFHLQTPLDLQVLTAAIEQLLTRHPVLRTSFDLTNFSEPLQLVHRMVEIPVQIEDLRRLSPAEQEEAIASWMEAEKKQNFDWNCPPLLRFQVHRRGEATFQFTLSFHHVILDGWSVALLLTELFEQYFFLLGKEIAPPLPNEAIAFRNFVALQKNALRSEECKRYWIQKLSDSTKTTLPRTSVSQTNTEAVRVLEIPVSAEISQKLKQLTQVAAVPLKSVLVAAHLRAIATLSGQSDILTILSANGRPDSGSDRSLGLFLTPLPFRMKLSGGTWLDLIREAFAAERELLPFRWYPMAQIQKDLGRQQLFETCFNFTHFHVYQRLKSFTDLQVLDDMHFEMTDFALLADFGLNVNTSQIKLFLKCHTSELSQQQIEEIGHTYFQTLTTLANEPTESYQAHEHKKPSLLLKQEQIESTSLQKLKTAKRKAIRG